MQVEGRLKKVFPFEAVKKKDGTNVITSKGSEFFKGGFVLQQKGQYGKEIFLDVIKEDVHQFVSNTDLETELIADINVDSREFQGRYFTSASCWKVNKLSNIETEKACENASNDDGDGLPF